LLIAMTRSSVRAMEAEQQRGSSEDTLTKLRRWSRAGGWGSRWWYSAYLASQVPFTIVLVMALLGMGRGHDWRWYVLGTSFVIGTGAIIGGDIAARQRRRDGWIPIEKEPWPMSLVTTGKWRRSDEPR
jgi:hypothetical protein